MFGVDSTDSGWSRAAGFCEHGNDYIKIGNVLTS